VRDYRPALIAFSILLFASAATADDNVFSRQKKPSNAELSLTLEAISLFT